MMWHVLALPLVEVVLIGALAGLVGCLAVLGRRVFFAEAVTHGTFPGAVLGVVVAQILGWNLSASLFAGAFLLCLPLTWLMFRLSTVISAEAAAGVVLTLGFGGGYFLNKWFQPLPLKIESFLTGSILTASTLDVAAAAAILGAALIFVGVFRRRLVFEMFDPVGYRAVGLKPLGGWVLALIMATVVVMIPAVGTILPLALLAAPAAGLRGWARSPGLVLALAPLVGVACGVTGLLAAAALNLSAGGMISLVAGGFYVLSAGAARLLRR